MRKILIISLLLLTKSIFSDGVVKPVNYTLLPYINIINEDVSFIFATGTLSSNVYSVKGIQPSALFSTTENSLYGLQLSGIYNYSGGNIIGIQAAGIFNIAAKKSIGSQISGVFNHNHGALNGLQLAGLFNITKSLSGVQIAGLFNSGNNVNGIQVGVVNYANKSKGLQLGVINISSDDNKTVPLGIINLYKNGILNFAMTYDGNGDISFLFESGNSWLFTQIFYITNQENITKPFADPVWGVGLGFRPLKPLDLVLGIKRDLNSYIPTPIVKLSLSYDFKKISITGGVTCDLVINNYNRDLISSTSNEIDFGEDLTVKYSWFTGVKLKL